MKTKIILIFKNGSFSALVSRRLGHLSRHPDNTILIFQSKSFSAPPVGSFYPALLSYAVFFLYHTLILQVTQTSQFLIPHNFPFEQPAALLTRVNLDFIMCPAPKCCQTQDSDNYGVHFYITILRYRKSHSFMLN